MHKKIFLIPLVFMFISTVFLYLLLIDRNPSEIPSALINKKFPKFESKTLFGEEKFISSEEFNNELILVNFFATWCVPCREEHIYIKNLSNKGLRIVGINFKDNEKKTKKWINELGNPYSHIVIDKKGKIAIDWGVYGIPETFIVDEKGIIKYRHVGPVTKKVYKKINLIIKDLNIQ